jgi:hypothetical protein
MYVTIRATAVSSPQRDLWRIVHPIEIALCMKKEKKRKDFDSILF